MILAADTLGSYGSMAAVRNLQRVFKVNDKTIIAGSGDYADYQLLLNIINEQVNSDYCVNDGYVYKPKALYSWCTRVLYNRRSRFDPLWNRLAIAGFDDDKPYITNRYILLFFSPITNLIILQIPWLRRSVRKLL